MLAAIDVQFKIVFWKLFDFGRVQNLLVGKGLNLWKLNTFTEDKLCMAENVVFVFDDFEKIVGKGENAGFHIVFKSPVSSKPRSWSFFPKFFKNWDCIVKGILQDLQDVLTLSFI